MTRPNFLILGAQKAGSTWLAANLAQHPAVFLYPNEIQYFNVQENYTRGPAWYEHHFEQATSTQSIVGEKTPNYMWVTDTPVCTPFGTHLPNIHRAIADYLPEAKFLVMLRDPVQRAVSAVNHYMRHGQLSPLNHIDDYLIGPRVAEAEQYGVFEMGNYYEALQAYFSVCDPARFLILEFANDIVAEPKACLRAVCQFLDIDDQYPFGAIDEKVNEFFARSVGVSYAMHRVPAARRVLRRVETKLPASLGSRFMGPPLKKQKPSVAALNALRERYRTPNRQLFELLDTDYPQWG